MNDLTNEQLIFLDNLIYFDLRQFKGERIVTAVETILSDPESFVVKAMNTANYGKMPASMTKEEWEVLLTAFLENDRDFLESYTIEHPTNDYESDDYFCASTFVKYSEEDNSVVEDIAVIFRGTFGNGPEWSDNILNGNRVWSYETDKSVLYIQGLKECYGDAANHLTVSGHSKGGNRAQYATILTDQVDRCVSLDGQGFSSEFLELYAEEIEQKNEILIPLSMKVLKCVKVCLMQAI